MKKSDLVIYGGILGLAYFLYSKYSGAISTAVNTVTQPLANAFVELTAPAAPIPQGAVLMPDGSTFPAANLTQYGFGFKNGVAQFTVNGRIYALSPQVEGNYQAFALS